MQEILQYYRRNTTEYVPQNIATTPEINALIERDAVVAVGVSGGKDSQACAIAVSRYLDTIGHQGPRVLIHADLGRVEWKDSLPTCERLAEQIGWELMVVRRKAGDMMDRWLGRWRNNVTRYENLECVKLILPWSTPSMRFCTSELKVAVITSALKKRFPGRDIINAAGIRREESAQRRKMPVSTSQPKLERKGYAGLNWNPIIEWNLEDVITAIKSARLELHEGYTRYQMSRISCAYCIMSSEEDLQSSTACPDNVAIYREMVDLEITSTYAFQGSRWLADVAPQLLSAKTRSDAQEAKEKAAIRQRLESEIPDSLMYVKGWPTSVPDHHEANILARIRRDIANLIQMDAQYLTADAVQTRYQELIAQNSAKNCRKKETHVSKVEPLAFSW
ncbi:phosphoadenosine phosphosulfate reductase domain-containing protein [Acidithiobacillus thiooxidans]|uniref:phosphoadenosine phosphosulfate reductase domain-containing protein n=1 Tax=Acidithiobacillus thiooxidans TaxID=930 RepID=UPI0009DA0A7B|nr:phosphoadenosine phosphosulfate reductase family protein [Acidithiobacillus thiooxidans]